MACTASISSVSHVAQFQYPPTCTTTTRTTRKTLNVCNTKRNDKSYKDFHFTSSSSSFPVNLRKSASNPIQLYPLQDSVRNDFLENSTNFLISTEESQQIIRDSVEKIETCSDLGMPRSESHQLMCLEPRRRIFIQDPPWISSIFLKGLYKRIKQQEVKLSREMERRKYNLLRRRQVKEETEAWERMVDEYKELEARMIEKKLAPNLPRIKSLFLGWFEPLREAIAKEQKVQRTKKQKAAYAPHIELLPADKMAVIVMHKMMGLVMAGHEDRCVQVVQAAVHIGMAIEQEVSI